MVPVLPFARTQLNWSSVAWVHVHRPDSKVQSYDDGAGNKRVKKGLVYVKRISASISIWLSFVCKSYVVIVVRS